jgi:hypothetical protein
MHLNMTKEVAALRKMTVQQLKARYAEVFGDETRTGNKAWLIKRIAWRLQANAEGGLSERARKRALELANDSDVRTTAPKQRSPELNAVSVSTIVTDAIKADPRLPISGTVLVRQYKNRTLQVRVLQRGFEFEGEVFKTLSAVARAITGQHCNGYHFFRLGKDTNQ